MRPELRHRLMTGTAVGALLVAAFMWAQTGLALLILAGLAAIGLREFYALLRAARIPSFDVIGTLAGIGIVAATWASLRWGRPDRGGDADLLALFVAFFAVFARQFHQRWNLRPLETMAGTLMGLLYVAFLMSFFVRILMGWGGGTLQGRWLLFYMIAVVKGSDIGAYFTGCAFGRHKLIPRISPAKSWEGVFGGVAAAVAISLAAWAFSDGRIGPVRLHAADAVVLGALLAAVGIVGDLAESLLKRAAGVKDSGALLKGMGGLLDVLDSLLPAAPVLYFYARYFLEPAARIVIPGGLLP